MSRVSGLATLAIVCAALGAIGLYTVQHSYPEETPPRGRLECWSLASEFMTQEGWQRAHRADKYAQRRDAELMLSPSPDIVCDDVDRAGLPRARHQGYSWWWRERGSRTPRAIGGDA